MSLLASLIGEAIRCGGSDLHLRPDEHPRVRVQGDVKPLSVSPTTSDQILGILQPYLCSSSLLGGQQIEFDTAFDLLGRRCRLHVFRENRGVAAVVRLLPSESPTIAGLALPHSIAAIAELERGLVLVTGAAGAGKSSTLAAMINHINSRRAAHIITLEDPIEVLHRPNRALVTQRQVPRDSESFVAGLRAALRQDPDVLLVGEMRDSETAGLVLTAAETGHLVLSTLHAGSAAQSISRMVDLFPGERQGQARATLADALSAIVSQELQPRVGGGRLPVTEILFATQAVRTLIREGKSHQLESVMQVSGRAGMITREQRVRQLREEGVLA